MNANRSIDSKNQIWFKVDGDLVNIGFTDQFLAKMDECWHILPAGDKVKEKDPLLTVETNDGLISVRSPASGWLFNFSDKALNFPDKLTTDDIVICINTKKTPENKAAKVSLDPVHFDVRAGGWAIADEAATLNVGPPPTLPEQPQMVQGGPDTWFVRPIEQAARAGALRTGEEVQRARLERERAELVQRVRGFVPPPAVPQRPTRAVNPNTIRQRNPR